MPRVRDDIVNCVVYLYPSEAAAEDGEQMGGSGFIGGVRLVDGPNTKSLLFVVTNKHIVHDGNMVVRLNKHDNTTDIIPLDQDVWYDHPDGDDITVCPIGLKRDVHKIDYILPERWLDRDFAKDVDIGIGEDVFAVGRFVNREGKLKNTPTLRFGNISQMPDEPILIDGVKQESFLVEMRSIPGYSGSPVFVEVAKYVTFGIKKEEIEKYGGVRFVLMHALLGINYCYINSKDNQNSGMAGVIPAWKIDDILERTEMKTIIENLRAESVHVASYPAAAK